MIIKRTSNRISNSSYLAQKPIERRKQKKLTPVLSQAGSIFDKQITELQSFKDLEIDKYPLLQYFISLSLFLFSIYVFASIAGITWGLPGFYKRQWWNFIIGVVCIAFGMAIMFNADCETFSIIRRQDLIIHSTYKFFCIRGSIEQNQISQITNIKIVESGAAKKVSLHSRWYGCEISFRNCKKITVLRCISQENTAHYKDQIISFLDTTTKNRVSGINNLRV